MSKSEGEQSACRWVPVTEAMPETWTLVAASYLCDGARYMGLVVLTDGGQWQEPADCSPMEDVTHWHPLAPLPEVFSCLTCGWTGDGPDYGDSDTGVCPSCNGERFHVAL